ncbi:hypothetical protein GQ53DRAFT_39389 [Thozetella sp. PMI_491]|nr:hypothetical protein GQ53DRAFT_39389 [Thozetella sp. PMI_491]
MWAVPSSSVLPGDRGASRKATKKAKKSLDAPPAVPPKNTSPPPTLYRNAAAAAGPAPPEEVHDIDAFPDLLGPAVEGPPSPESIRALSKQVKRSSYIDKHLSQHTSSSGSSSLRSLASADRPSWEQALDGFSLSRKSSGRSTNSSMPPRERPESVQIFGKTIFNRRTKMRRDSSAQGVSPGHSPYGAEFQSDTMLPPTPGSAQDAPSPGLFSRRRTLTRENSSDSGASKKFQISGPYNFQHVTHTQRDHLPNLQRSSRMALASDFSNLRASQMPTAGALKGIRAEDLHFADFSSEALPIQEEEDEMAEEEEQDTVDYHLPQPPLPSPAKNRSPPRRMIKHTRSQEQLYMKMSPPPRPPRSPIGASSMMPSPPIPPPRLSSRASIAYDAEGQLVRPQTSGGFRQPQPLAIDREHPSPPSTSYGFHAPEIDAAPGNRRFSRIISPPDDANWPLPCPTSFTTLEQTLAEVPEEEENTIHARRSRASVASNSSLRGSQSVPMLRALSLRQETANRRRSSGASETLGSLFAAGRALKASLEQGDGPEDLPRESWEDDIDYCYDHAAEADCDYAWDRPSLDLVREDENATPMFRMPTIESCEPSPAMLTPGQFEVPALSPASQVSLVTPHEAITPTAAALPRASNFSMPRPDTSLLHMRKASTASSFKESHGFNLSPTLLIPRDFEEAMLADVAEHHDFEFQPYEEPTLNMESSTLLVQPRSSASTTASIDTTHTNGFERHISTTSASTDFTRLTMSTSSLDRDSYMLMRSESMESLPSLELTDAVQPMPTLPESEEVGELPALRRHFATSGSDPNLVALAKGPSSPTRTKDPILARRARARTTSLSTPPPPGQYSLFPGVQMTGTRI